MYEVHILSTHKISLEHDTKPGSKEDRRPSPALPPISAIKHRSPVHRLHSTEA